MRRLKTISKARFVSASYPLLQEISTRVSDVDTYGHLNAIRLGQYYEDARAAFYRSVLGQAPNRRTLVAELKMRYLREGEWPGDIQVGTGVLTIGATSLVMAQALFQNGGCIGLADTVLVRADASRSIPLETDIRERLQNLMLRGG